MLLMLLAFFIKVTQEACFPRVKEQAVVVQEPVTPTALEERLASKIAEAGPRVYHENWAYCPPHYFLKPEVRPDLRVTLQECRECGILEGYPCQI